MWMLVAAVAGWWSSSEYLAPVECRLAEACLGVDITVLAPNIGVGSGTPAGATTVDTRNCADGYEGQRCGQCSPSYYVLNQRCYYCGSDTDQSREMIIVGVVASMLMVVLAGVVGFMPPVPLAMTAKVVSVLRRQKEQKLIEQCQVGWIQTLTIVFWELLLRVVRSFFHFLFSLAVASSKRSR